MFALKHNNNNNNNNNTQIKEEPTKMTQKAQAQAQAQAQAEAERAQVANAQALPITIRLDPNYPPIFNYDVMEWELDVEPTEHPYKFPKNQLYHLYTVSGHLFIGMWPTNMLLAANCPSNHMHIIGWAPVENATGIVH